VPKAGDQVSRLNIISEKTVTPLQVISNTLMLIMLALVFTEVVSRYAFHASRGFMEEFAKWSQIWIAYLMLGVVEKKHQHIAVDILPKRLPPVYRTILMIVIDIVTFVFCVLLFISGIQTILNWMSLGYISGTEFTVPMWTVVLCVPLGAVCLAFFSVRNLVADLGNLNKRELGNSDADL
jgi:TRAP-type C4-dicarboxylate transport system permease small subunit